MIPYILVSVLYPFALLAGSTIRASVISYGYFLVFILSLLLLPHRLLRKHNIISSILPWITTGLALGSVITIVLANSVPSMETSETIQQLGFFKYTSFLQGLINVLPDIIVATISSLSATFWTRHMVFGQSDDDDHSSIDIVPQHGSLKRYPPLHVALHKRRKEPIYYNSPPSITLTHFAFVMLVLSAISYPSVINACYFIVVVGLTLCLSLQITLHSLMTKLYPLLIGISSLQLLFIYLFQLPIMDKRYGANLSDWFGVRNYHQWDVSIWPIIVGYVSILFLFISSCLILRQQVLYNLTIEHYKSQQSKQKKRDKITSANNSATTGLSRLTHISLLFSTYGWTICCAEIMVLCLFLQPSIYTIILLTIGLVSTVVPLALFKLLARLTHAYLLIFIVLQFLFNIPLQSWEQSSTSELVGFFIWPTTRIWLYVGTQMIVAFTFGLYCYYSAITAGLKLSDFNPPAPKKVEVDQPVLIDISASEQQQQHVPLDSDKVSGEPLVRPSTLKQRQHRMLNPTPTTGTGGVKGPIPPAKKTITFQLPGSGGSVTGRMSPSPSSVDFSYYRAQTSLLADNWSNFWRSFYENHKDTIQSVRHTTNTVFAIFSMTIIEQSYRLALAGLFFCGLTSITLLNAGYMVFFILFVISEYLASRFWILLVVYAQAVVVLLYAWQIQPTDSLEDATTEMIGLVHFEKQRGQAVWFGMIWQVVIVTFSLIQWNLSRFVTFHSGLFQAGSGALDEDHLARQQRDLPKAVKLIMAMLYSATHKYALPFCYLVIVLVASFSKISFISMVYMATVFTCLTVHYLSSNGTVHIRRFWLIIVITQAVILVARYVYQFTPVNTWLQRIFPTNKYITLDDIGLTVYSSDYFLVLFGNVAILVVCVFQLNCFFDGHLDNKDPRYSVEHHMKHYPRFQMMLYRIGRFTYVHGCKLVLWAVFLISISPPTFFNSIYLVMVLISMTFKKGTYRIGFYLLIYSQAIVLLQMAFLFPEAAGVIGHEVLMRWLGMPTSDQSTWDAVNLNLTIILIISIQQFAFWWNKSNKKPKSEAEAEAEAEAALNDEESPLIKYQERMLDNDNDDVLAAKPAPVKKNSNRLYWYLTHFYQLYGVEIVFVVMAFALSWRVNIVGLVYLAVIGTGLYIHDDKMHRLFYLTAFMVPIILVQYVFFLGIPTNDPHPWNLSNALLNNLLVLTAPSVYILILDFSVLFFSMLLLRQDSIRTPADPRLIYPRNFLKVDDSDFTLEPRRWNAELRYIIVRYSSQVTLVTMFIAGTAQCDIISSGYVFFSIYALYSGHDDRWSQLWQAMQVYNWCVLVLQILFQFIFVLFGTDNVATNRLADLLGFIVLSYTSINTVSKTISDVIIMVLLAYQKMVYQSHDFETMTQHLESNRLDAMKIAVDFYKNRRETRLSQLSSVQSIIMQRRQRLQNLKSNSNFQKRQSSLYSESSATLSYPSGQLSTTSNIHGEVPRPPSPGLSTSPSLGLSPNQSPTQEPITIVTALTTSTSSTSQQHDEQQQQPQQQQEEVIKSTSVGEKIKAFFNSILDWLDPLPENHDAIISGTVSYPRNSTYFAPEALQRSISQLDQGQEVAENKGDDPGSSSSSSSSTEPSLAGDPSIKRDDVFKRIVRGLSRMARDESKWIAFMCCLANSVFYANVVSLVYVYSVLLYGRLFESPKPSKSFWGFLIGYSSLIIFLKYIFNIGFFCVVSGVDGYYYASFDTCWDSINYNDQLEKRYLSAPYLIGINDIQGPFLAGAFWDLAVFLACLWHRHVYRSKGLWIFDEKSILQVEQSSSTIVTTSLDTTGDQHMMQDHDHDQGASSSSNVDPNNNNNNVDALVPTTTQARTIPDTQPLLDVDDEEQEVDHEVVDIADDDDDDNNDDGDLEAQSPPDTHDHMVDSADALHKQTVQDNSSQVLNFIRNYFHNVVDVSEKTGRDYYLPILFTDFFCLVFLVIFPQNFTAIPSSDITQFLAQNVIPRQFIAILLIQFSLIILDRIIYLYRSVIAKYILQVILTVIYTVFLLFYFPDLIQKPFDFRFAWTLCIFYILKCLYLYYSALQICYGYPILVGSRFLMDGHSAFHNIGFSVYRGIPFVFEMRTLLDWICTDTTLLLYDWLKFEDIYAEIFSVHLRQEWIKRQGRKKGHKQPLQEKFISGVCVFAGIAVILWFPLIILSSGLPGSNVEPVTSVQVQVSIMGLNPFITMNEDLSVSDLNGVPVWKNTFVNNTVFSQLRSNETFITADDQAGTQSININKYSESNWNLSPPARNQLIQSLLTNELTIRADYVLSRSGNVNINIAGINVVKLNSTQQSRFLSIINGTAAYNNFTTPALFYKFMRLPGVSGNLYYPFNPGHTPEMIDVTFTMINIGNDSLGQVQQYWEMTQVDGTPINIITISAKLPNGLASSLVSVGIIGLYVGIVLSVSKFLRMSVTGMAFRITLENIEFCGEVEQMIEDVLIARQYGDLQLEEELYKQLIQVFRNTIVLYQMTTTNKQS
ncbi:hypothetical protein SAMD00019534_012690 [Acytostelium subglobosum LB1]|uniref:hypothetical protein n=1 Tax=Acytostelium subglobosum LB1 TaxID=1410327 RepID=UPI000644CF2E|nr:hypothetical protein SAMD00019534_012690 [Acytostelium subglobosum LB1]GAM18094.1 hypothetical protein SAMD00019534_012690 [Acytostelium subglobosum LB1]|eukprot:XP_012758690.1 hypothetical protein SAMD00019534_012690 [Acytostelium subglobosum LB1]